MAYRAFDTETSGLIPRDFSDKGKLPYVLQFSSATWNPETNTFSTTNDYINVGDNVVIDEHAFNTHGITKEFLHKNGTDVKSALQKFKDQNEDVSTNLAHNFDFDKQMLTIEGDRHNIYDLFPKGIHHICTMKKTKNMCNVKGTNSKGEEFIKYPKMASCLPCVSK